MLRGVRLLVEVMMTLHSIALDHQARGRRVGDGSEHCGGVVVGMGGGGFRLVKKGKDGR